MKKTCFAIGLLTVLLLLFTLPFGCVKVDSEVRADGIGQTELHSEELDPSEIAEQDPTTVTTETPNQDEGIIEPDRGEPSPSDQAVRESAAPAEEAEAEDAAVDRPIYREPQSDRESYLAACARVAVRVRRGAGTSYGVLSTLGIGDSLPYLWQEGGWYAVWTGERVGYLSAAYAYLAETTIGLEKTIRAGLAKLGTPYEWGAPRLLNEYGERSPYFTGKSFDCSSFVQYCYYVGQGIKLGNYTGSQADCTVGERITDYASLKRGDFYFTGTNGRISHVVIYLGGGLLLQSYSANGGPVSVTSDDRWKGKFLSGRRPDPTVVEQFRAKN